MFNIEFHCDEKENFKKGYKARALTYKDYSIEMHTHDFYEVNVVLAGSGTHCIENGRFKTTPGDVFVIPPNIAHAYCDTNDLEVYHILLKKSFLSHNSSETKKVEGFLQLTEIEPILRSNFSNSYFGGFNVIFQNTLNTSNIQTPHIHIQFICIVFYDFQSFIFSILSKQSFCVYSILFTAYTQYFLKYVAFQLY